MIRRAREIQKQKFKKKKNHNMEVLSDADEETVANRAKLLE